MKEFALAVLFTGHRVDAPGRAVPRFPAEAEGKVRAAIREAVLGVRRQRTVGVAAGASGGDILFHEICAELGVPTRLMLGVQAEDFVLRSVAAAGADWERRFWEVAERAQVSVMEAGEGKVWARANAWMVERAEEIADERVLIALWDGKGGDGPGGTENFVRTAGCEVKVVGV